MKLKRDSLNHLNDHYNRYTLDFSMKSKYFNSYPSTLKYHKRHKVRVKRQIN